MPTLNQKALKSGLVLLVLSTIPSLLLDSVIASHFFFEHLILIMMIYKGKIRGVKCIKRETYFSNDKIDVSLETQNVFHIQGSDMLYVTS